LIGFEIYRSLAKNGEYIKISKEMIKTNYGSPEGHFYQRIDRNLENGKTYWYKLKCIYNTGESEYTDPFNVTPLQNSKYQGDSF
jgi:hypothetical protein